MHDVVSTGTKHTMEFSILNHTTTKIKQQQQHYSYTSTVLSAKQWVIEIINNKEKLSTF